MLDTGAMYRAVTLAAIRARIDLQSDQLLGELAGRIKVVLPPGRVLLDDEDVTTSIRDVEVTRATRHAADSPRVRSVLVSWQREFARQEGDVITEGGIKGRSSSPMPYASST